VTMAVPIRNELLVQLIREEGMRNGMRVHTGHYGCPRELNSLENPTAFPTELCANFFSPA
jgi:hypothetical protein